MQYNLVADAITKIFSPFAEVVIHNLRSGKIQHISGNLSQRKVGDDSLIDVVNLKEEELGRVYEQDDLNGKVTKSISVKLDKQYLMCINYDVSILININKLAESLIQPIEGKEKPKSLFINDWQDSVKEFIKGYLKNKDLKLRDLSKEQIRNLILEIDDLKAFENKKSHEYVANLLGVSRATIFNYLKKVR